MMLLVQREALIKLANLVSINSQFPIAASRLQEMKKLLVVCFNKLPRIRFLAVEEVVPPRKLPIHQLESPESILLVLY
jgi:hypothetical protein